MYDDKDDKMAKTVKRRSQSVVGEEKHVKSVMVMYGDECGVKNNVQMLKSVAGVEDESWMHGNAFKVSPSPPH
jgi:hypothetical protein